MASSSEIPAAVMRFVGDWRVHLLDDLKLFMKPQTDGSGVYIAFSMESWQRVDGKLEMVEFNERVWPHWSIATIPVNALRAAAWYFLEDCIAKFVVYETWMAGETVILTTKNEPQFNDLGDVSFYVIEPTETCGFASFFSRLQEHIVHGLLPALQRSRVLGPMYLPSPHMVVSKGGEAAYPVWRGDTLKLSLVGTCKTASVRSIRSTSLGDTRRQTLSGGDEERQHEDVEGFIRGGTTMIENVDADNVGNEAQIINMHGGSVWNVQ